MTNILIYGILSGIAAAVFHAILIHAGHILSGPRKLVEGALFKLGTATNYGRAWKALCWITQSAVDCSWCLGGQLGLFAYIWHGGRDPFDAILQTCLAILATVVAFQFLKNVQAK